MVGMSLKGKGILTYGRKFFQPFTTMRNPKGTDLSVCILKMSNDTVI